jgi:hypothetical protein
MDIIDVVSILHVSQRKRYSIEDAQHAHLSLGVAESLQDALQDRQQRRQGLCPSNNLEE